MRGYDQGTAAHQADGAVDRLLAGLREDMPGDLEARLFECLEAAAAKRGRAQRRWPFLRSHVALLGSVTALAGLVLAVTLSQRSPSRRPDVSVQPQLHDVGTVIDAEVVHPSRPAPIRRTEADRPAPEPLTVSAAEIREQALWDDFRAPTQVAPPIPLTPEERKMHRLILDARAPQVASLDPILQEMEADRANAAREHAAAEYEGFFRQPPPPPEIPTEVPIDSADSADSADLKGTQP